MATITVLRTLSGSEYRLRHDPDGSWWVSGRNRPSPFSQPLGGRWWPVVPPVPWPPILGCSLYIRSLYDDDPGHPDRMPGGGKFTSAVLAVETLAAGTPTDRMPACPTCGGHQGTWRLEPALVRGPSDPRWIELPVRRCTECRSVVITARAPGEPQPYCPEVARQGA